jgi:hypothetical protein
MRSKGGAPNGVLRFEKRIVGHSDDTIREMDEIEPSM